MPVNDELLPLVGKAENEQKNINLRETLFFKNTKIFFSSMHKKEVNFICFIRTLKYNITTWKEVVHDIHIKIGFQTSKTMNI